MATRRHKKLSNTTMLFIVIAIALAIIIISGGMSPAAQFAKAGTKGLTAPIAKPTADITVNVTPNIALRNRAITIKVDYEYCTRDLDTNKIIGNISFDGTVIKENPKIGITEINYAIPSSTSLGMHTVKATCQVNWQYWIDTYHSEASVAVISGCGDSIIDSGEKCETNDLAGATCQSLGFLKGTLACNSNCQYDTSNCSTPSYCNDGICSAGETATSCPADCAAGRCTGTHVSCSVFAGEPSVCQKHGCITGGMGGQLCTGTPHSCSSIPTKGFCDAEAAAGCSWQ